MCVSCLCPVSSRQTSTCQVSGFCRIWQLEKHNIPEAVTQSKNIKCACCDPGSVIMIHGGRPSVAVHLTARWREAITTLPNRARSRLSAEPRYDPVRFLRLRVHHRALNLHYMLIVFSLKRSRLSAVRMLRFPAAITLCPPPLQPIWQECKWSKSVGTHLGGEEMLFSASATCLWLKLIGCCRIKSTKICCSSTNCGRGPSIGWNTSITSRWMAMEIETGIPETIRNPTCMNWKHLFSGNWTITVVY